MKFWKTDFSILIYNHLLYLTDSSGWHWREKWRNSDKQETVFLYLSLYTSRLSIAFNCCSVEYFISHVLIDFWYAHECILEKKQQQQHRTECSPKVNMPMSKAFTLSGVDDLWCAVWRTRGQFTMISPRTHSTIEIDYSIIVIIISLIFKLYAKRVRSGGKEKKKNKNNFFLCVMYTHFIFLFCCFACAFFSKMKSQCPTFSCCWIVARARWLLLARAR